MSPLPSALRRVACPLLIITTLLLILSPFSARGAEIYIDRTGTRQLNFANLTDGSMNNLGNDPVPLFNIYTYRVDATNPIQWTHTFDLTQPSDGTIAIDTDEVFINLLAAELFPVIWDIDYPVSNEHDTLYWDSVVYAGGTGNAFSMAANPAAQNLGWVQGNNNWWGAKRITLNTAFLAPGTVEHFWLRSDEDPATPNWATSIDYSDLAYIFNAGDLAVNKTSTLESGFDPPRVGYTSVYRVRVAVSNPTTTALGGPMYDVVVTDVFPAGSTIATAPTLGTATLNAAGNLNWNVGVLQDGALNVPPAAGSTGFMEVLVPVTPTKAQEGATITINAGATITGDQVPLDPGDGTGTLYPFNFHANVANNTTNISVAVATGNVTPANTGTITATPNINPAQAITITVTDADLNTSAAAINTHSITVVNLATGESESLTLTETGVNTGIFTANLNTMYGATAGPNNDAVMRVQGGDTVRATYNDAVNNAGIPATATANTAVTSGVTGTLTSLPATINPGASVTLTLTDNDLNTNAGSAQTVTLATTNSRTGESELLTYTETGVNTGVFTATLLTTFNAAAGVNNNGSMNCQSGDLLNTQYNDAVTNTGGSATITATTIATGGSTGTITATASIMPGQAISLTLVDADLNTNAGAANTVSITLTSSNGESESITLTETGPNTGAFTASVPTTFGGAAGANNNGTFNAQAGDTITATYNDALTGAGGAATVTASASVSGGSSGTLSATPALLPGQAVTFTLADTDLNTNAGAVDSLSLAVANPSTGETETLTFLETGANTGIFTATVNTVFGATAGANNDGVFNVQAAHIITGMYNDALTAAGGTASVSASATITGGRTGTAAATAQINPGQSMSAVIEDADLNSSPAAVNTISMTLTNATTGETETLTFTETGPDTGRFAAVINTQYGAAAGANNDGIFVVRNGQTISFTYTDTLTATGGTGTASAATAVVDDTNFVTITGPTGLSNTAVHNVTGTTDPVSTVTMDHPISGVTLSTTANASGAYTFNNVTFPEGTTVFMVQSVDPAGNRAVAAATLDVDTRNSITMTSPVPNSTITSLAATVTGTTDPDSTVTLVEPGTGNTLTTTANSSGAFTFNAVAFTAGVNTFNFTSTDPIGNVATANPSIIVDPDITLNITSITNGSTYSNPLHAVAGVSDPFAVLTTTDPISNAPLTTTADAAGNYSFGTLTFTEGVHTVTVNGTDTAGNTAFTSVTFTVDSSNFNNILTTGLITTSLVDITGTTNPNSTVTMKHPQSGQSYTAIANNAGTYLFDDIFFSDGTYNITTTSTDPQGNVAVDAETITVDATVGLTVDLPPNNSVVDTITVDITGTSDPGATITILEPATDLEISVVADANGNFTFTGVDLVPGVNYITFVAVDPRGNSTSHLHTLYYDPNLGLTISAPLHNSVVQNPVQTVTGTTAPGATVTYPDPQTGAILTTTASAAGSYSFPPATFNMGSNTLSVTASDGVNTVTASITFVVANVGNTATLTASERTVFGFPIILEVDDFETYMDPNKNDTITVVVTNPRNGDSEVRTLVETAPNTGIFRGRLDTAECRNSDGISGVLCVQFNDIVTTRYIDAIQGNGSLNVTIQKQTLITNDELRINVNVLTSTGAYQVQALPSHPIAIMEYDANGQLTGKVLNYTTSADGNIPTEFVGYMETGASYRIIIKEQYLGFPYSASEDFALSDIQSTTPDARGVRTLIIVLDPAGFVYDALTGVRIAGADVTLYHENGTPVAGPFANYTHNPSSTQTNPQLSGASGVAGGFEFIGSSAGSDLSAGFYYITVTFNTTPALAALYDPIARSAASWAGIQEPYTGQVFRVDQANQPIGMRVPLTPQGLQTPLTLEKSANKDAAMTGDFVTYTVTVANLSASPTDAANPVMVRDTLPPGLTFHKGSAVRPDGTAVTVEQSGGGVVQFSIGQLLAAGTAGDSVTIYYRAAINTAARPGYLLTNQAVAMINGFSLSNTDRATVRVISDPIFDRATLIGKVFEDLNGNGIHDNSEPGLAGVSVLMDDGTYVTTDAEGKYSVPGAAPGPAIGGMRVVKIVRRTLPAHATLTTPESLFVTLTPGGMDKANFGVLRSADDAEQGHSEEDDQDTAKGSNKEKSIFLAMFDASIGEGKAGAGPRPYEDVFPVGQSARSRMAWFYSGNPRANLHITSAYDSAKDRTYDMFPDRDPDLFYPTYGDSSTVQYLTQSQGKFFLDARTPSAQLLIGNYTAHFANTDLAGIRRSLSGIKYEYKNSQSQEDLLGLPTGDQVLLFTSKHKQLHARTQFRSTGGSHYYLAHSRIVAGSEYVTVEIRDALAQDRVLARRALTRDTDYEIDYISGAVRLLNPVARFADGHNLTSPGLMGGDPIWITAEYTYDAQQSETGAFGARWQHLTNAPNKIGLPPMLTIGASYLQENADGRDRSLRGLDLHWANAFNAEWASSVSQGISWLASQDGGRSFQTLGSVGSQAGGAFKADLTMAGSHDIVFHNAYYDVDADFNGAFNERGIRRWISNLTFSLGTTAYTLDYTRASSQTGATTAAQYFTGGLQSSSLRAGACRPTKHGRLEFEFLRENRTSPDTATGLEPGITSTLAVRYERRMTDRITAALRQQATLSERDDHRTAIEIAYTMRKDFTFKTEFSAGNLGTGMRIGFEKIDKNGSRAYFDVTSGYDPETLGTRTGTAAGVSGPLARNTTGYMEHENISRDAEHIARRSIGINHTYDADNGFLVTLGLERSEDRSSLQGGYFTNSASVRADYAAEKSDTRLSAGAEFRTQRGAIHKAFYGYNVQAKGTFWTDMHSFAEYAYQTGDDQAASRTDSKYTKILVGFAWRPSHNDRLNFITRAARIREMRATTFNDAWNPDTISNVYSIEGLYDLHPRFTIRQKLAAKTIRERGMNPVPDARSRTTLWISGFTWNASDSWDLRAEYRAMHQPTHLNQRNGLAMETGYTFDQKIRVGVGYNLSSHTDDEFQSNSFSNRGLFLKVQGKF
jgi:hypothetical protein